LLALSVSPFSSSETIINSIKSKARRKKLPKPVAVFDGDPQKAADHAFCRDSGKRVSRGILKSYADALASYHLHPEDKILNADYCDKGTTRRRHIKASAIRHIGKETNDWEAQAVLGFDPDAAPDYGLSIDELAKIAARVTAVGLVLTNKMVSLKLGLSNAKLRQLKSSVGNWCGIAATIDQRLLMRLENEAIAKSTATRLKLEQLQSAVREFGLRRAALMHGIDHANLRRTMIRFEAQNLHLLDKRHPSFCG
jgi:hypothetical protein